MEQKCIMIIAGEASGDLHGSKLVDAMLKKEPDLFFCGIGGQALNNAGAKIYVDSSSLSVVGITEVFSKIPNIFKGVAVAKRLLKSLKPDLLILIDFPDFNLHIAAFAKKIGIPVLYYISPQIWAWRSRRINKIKKLVDHMAVIFPFEEDYYKKYDIPVTYVGHPLLDSKLSPANKISGQTSKSNNVIGLLPGSRKSEIVKHLPVMLDAAGILIKRLQNIKFIISVAPALDKKLLEKSVLNHKDADSFELSEESVENIFKRCKIVISASGTVTLEAAISGIPMVIIYKISPVSYWIGKALVHVNNISLVNLIAGKEIIPELIQGEASPLNIADVVYEMIRSPASLKKLRNELSLIRKLLGVPGASDRVADLAIGMMQKRV